MSVLMEVVEMTPVMATELLRENRGNRAMSRLNVESIVGAMLRGEWMENGETIKVSKSGRLLDGQHRLAAVVQADVALPMVVVSGLDDASFETIDKGRRRTTGDTLTSMGVANSNVMAAAGTILFKYLATGDPFNTAPKSRPTTHQVLEIIDLSPGLPESARFAASSNFCRRYFGPSLTAFAHYVFSDDDPVAAYSFFDELDDGVGLPILLLRDRLITTAAGKHKIPQKYKGGLLFKSYKHFRSGRPLGTLRIASDEKNIFALRPGGRS